MSGRERRFRAWVNHDLSRAIVRKAQRSRRGLALDDLKGIRDRVKARRPQRARLHGWAFDQLRAFLAYKATRAGVPVLFVDPRNTSRTCPECGCVDCKNRSDQAMFSCVSCGHAAPADTVAARNIRAQAAVNRPVVLDAA